MEFKGATTFTKHSIDMALDKYRKEVEWAKQLLKDKVALAESQFKPTWFDKLRGKNTLQDKYNNMFMTYEGNLYVYNLIDFEEDELSRLRNLCYYGLNYLGIWEYKEEYEQVYNLSLGGESYFNPDQAGFIDKYRNLE